MKRFTLVTDLDNTLIGDNEATLQLMAELAPMREQFYLIYATGRTFDSVAHLLGFFQLLTHQTLLTPDYLIASVGTMIYHCSYLDQAWGSHLDTEWNRSAIESITQLMPELILQKEKEQNPWKISFHLHSDHPQDFIDRLHTHLFSRGLPCQIIFSSERDVDIVPIGANKGLAVRWVQEKLGIEALPTLVCGDSGNDIGLFEQHFWGVIVRNAQPELLHWYGLHGSDRILWAKASYAAAILEGLYHFQLLG